MTDPTDKLAERWYNLVARGWLDIRPWSQISSLLQDKFRALARDAMQIWSDRETQLRKELKPPKKRPAP